MKYPKIQSEKLDYINRRRFDIIIKEIRDQIEFDNSENDLGLSRDDINLIAWNMATRLITFV